MGSASPPVRPISPTITDAIQALLKSAAKSGVTIINVTEEAARLRHAIPDCELSEDEIAVRNRKAQRTALIPWSCAWTQQRLIQLAAPGRRALRAGEDGAGGVEH